MGTAATRIDPYRGYNFRIELDSHQRGLLPRVWGMTTEHRSGRLQRGH